MLSIIDKYSHAAISKQITYKHTHTPYVNVSGYNMQFIFSLEDDSKDFLSKN